MTWRVLAIGLAVSVFSSSLLAQNSKIEISLPTDNDALFRGGGPDFYQYIERDFHGEKSTPWEGGRYGFVLNTQQSLVNIFDAASNRMVHEFHAGKSPDQIMFSDTFAFVRSLDTENVEMLRLATIGKEVDITEFPGGHSLSTHPAAFSARLREVLLP